MRLIPLLFCGAVFLSTINSARSSHIEVVDQQNQQPTYNLSVLESGIGSGIGQSFTPTMASLDAAEFTIRAGLDEAGSAVTVRLDLFAGAGYAGLLLASSQPVTFSGPNSQLVQFLFASSVVVTPETIYTLRITLTAGDGYSVSGTTGDMYTRGNVYFENGSAGPAESDLGFAEGSAVPEPASVFLMLIGAAAVACKIRNKKVAAEN